MTDKDLLIKTINEQEAYYNEQMSAVTSPFSSPGYHTTLTAADGDVHSTRTAAHYALALLDSELAIYRNRAFAVIKKLLAAQDTDSESATYGIWSWFYEEPLEQMAPPDWNWADFIGKPLVLIMKRHRAVLPQQLAADIESSISHACEAIIRRNVGPEYTNIAVMGAFVTLIAGEVLQQEHIRQYGFERLQRFYTYTMEIQSFQEFNSPTYTIIAIEELSSIWTETTNEEARDYARALINIAWRMAAVRFHPASKQWAGPHARAYRNLLHHEALTFLQLALGDKVKLIEQEDMVYQTIWYRNNISCPKQYIDYFITDRTELLVEPIPYMSKDVACVATTYNTEQFSLSSFSCYDMWNQRRSLLAYWATDAGAVYMHTRMLHEHYDFCSAIVMVQQQRQHALFGITFVTDGGDTHVNLDMVHNGTIMASDMRIRFELGGAIGGLQAQWRPASANINVETDVKVDANKVVEADVSIDVDVGEAVAVAVDGAIAVDDTMILELRQQTEAVPMLQIDIAAAHFGTETVRYEVTRSDDLIFADIILYEGEAKSFDLRQLGEAYIAGQLIIQDRLPTLQVAECQRELYQPIAHAQGKPANQVGLSAAEHSSNMRNLQAECHLTTYPSAQSPTLAKSVTSDDRQQQLAIPKCPRTRAELVNWYKAKQI